ncbi:MAG: MBL fold metallo-hydrolase [Deltaproteobacteria bacterium]|nr:MBL fold metallo-hydrolase [Deltaproteobacteria bacterium]
MKENTVQRIETKVVTIHVVTVPEEAELTNVLVLETKNKLVMIDVPLLEPYARELAEYVASLGKPVDRLLVTHAHPDHWFTRSVFEGVRCQAFKETIDEIAVLMPLQIGYHQQLHGALMAKQITPPVETITPGPLEIDGLQLQLHNFADTEDSALMVTELPAIKMMLAQDLVCVGCHLYLGTKDAKGRLTIDNWIAAVQKLERQGFERVVPGHGPITDPLPYRGVIEYLEFAKQAIARCSTADEFKAEMNRRFPEHRVSLVLEMTAFMLYQWGK